MHLKSERNFARVRKYFHIRHSNHPNNMAELEVINSINAMTPLSNLSTPEMNSRSSSHQIDHNLDVDIEEKPSSKMGSDIINESIAALEQHETEFIDQQKQKQDLLHASLTDRSKVPESYYSNSKKEDLVLSFAENFNRQYSQLYPGRKELLLAPPNEMETKVNKKLFL